MLLKLVHGTHTLRKDLEQDGTAGEEDAISAFRKARTRVDAGGNVRTTCMIILCTRYILHKSLCQDSHVTSIIHDFPSKLWRARPHLLRKADIQILFFVQLSKMPPPLTMLFRAIRPQPHVSAASFLAPFLRQVPQQRSASILGSLSDTPGAYNKRIRRGRGASSGKGKTSGRGHKGQKQHGKVPTGFNGGQTPDIVVSGERGFENQ